MKIIEKLEALNVECKDVEELYGIFNSISLDKHLFMPISLEERRKIVRLRINEKDKSFYNISELTYPPAVYIKENGRANISGSSMFYGVCVSSDQKAINPRGIVAFEVSSMLQDVSIGFSGIERHTYSVWYTSEKMNLIALPLSECSYEQPCEEIIKINEQWRNVYKRYNIDEGTKQLVDYMSNAIARKATSPKDYFIIANYIHYLLYRNDNTKYADGIIYPTVKCDGSGFNIAIKPKVVGEKLHFEGAIESHLIKRGSDSVILDIKDAKVMNKIGDLQYVTSESFDIEKYNRIASGLSFIN